MRSPLRYPGGKSKAIDQIIAYIPTNITTLCSPFVGGGSIEIALAKKGIGVYAYDIFEPLVCFWKHLIFEPYLLAEYINKYIGINKDQFIQLQKTVLTLSNGIEKAAIFFVLNRCSFSGTILSGGMSINTPRFNTNSIQRVKDFNLNGLKVQCKDFKQSIANHPADFLYCDPPYLIDQKLYGKNGTLHTNFDHEGLANILKSRNNWVLSYNDCPQIRNLYKDYPIDKLHWSYSMGDSKKSNEIIIRCTGL